MFRLLLAVAAILSATTTTGKQVGTITVNGNPSPLLDSQFAPKKNACDALRQAERKAAMQEQIAELGRSATQAQLEQAKTSYPLYGAAASAKAPEVPLEAWRSTAGAMLLEEKIDAVLASHDAKFRAILAALEASRQRSLRHLGSIPRADAEYLKAARERYWSDSALNGLSVDVSIADPDLARATVHCLR